MRIPTRERQASSGPPVQGAFVGGLSVYSGSSLDRSADAAGYGILYSGPAALQFGVWGSGFGVRGLGFGVQGLGFRVQGLGFRVVYWYITRLGED